MLEDELNNYLEAYDKILKGEKVIREYKIGYNEDFKLIKYGVKNG